MEDKRICLHIIQLFLAVNNEMQRSLNPGKSSDQLNMTVKGDRLSKSETADDTPIKLAVILFLP